MLESITVDAPGEIAEIIFVEEGAGAHDLRAVPLDKTRKELSVDLSEYPQLAARVRERVPTGLSVRVQARKTVYPDPV